jgi:hypothetical protein
MFGSTRSCIGCRSSASRQLPVVCGSLCRGGRDRLVSKTRSRPIGGQRGTSARLLCHDLDVDLRRVVFRGGPADGIERAVLLSSKFVVLQNDEQPWPIYRIAGDSSQFPRGTPGSAAFSEAVEDQMQYAVREENGDLTPLTAPQRYRLLEHGGILHRLVEVDGHEFGVKDTESCETPYGTRLVTFIVESPEDAEARWQRWRHEAEEAQSSSTGTSGMHSSTELFAALATGATSGVIGGASWAGVTRMAKVILRAGVQDVGAARLAAEACLLHHVGSSASVRMVAQQFDGTNWLVDFQDTDGPYRYVIQVPRGRKDPSRLPFSQFRIDK